MHCNSVYTGRDKDKDRDRDRDRDRSQASFYGWASNACGGESGEGAERRQRQGFMGTKKGGGVPLTTPPSF